MKKKIEWRKKVEWEAGTIKHRVWNILFNRGIVIIGESALIDVGKELDTREKRLVKLYLSLT